MIRYPFIPTARRAACVLALLAASPCFASLQSVKDAQAALKFSASCRVNADLSEDCTNAWHYDLLTATGRDGLSQVSLSSPENQTISDLEAYVIKRDGTRTRLPDSQIVKKSGTGPDQGIDNSTSTVLLFQGLQTGGSIEYRYKEHTKAVKGLTTFGQTIDLPLAPIRYDRFHFDYTADQPIIWRGEEPDIFNVKSSEGGKKITIDLAKPRYFVPENEDGLTVRKHPRIELAFSDKLEDHYGTMVGIYNKILSQPLPPQAAKEVARLKGKPREVQIQALVKFLDDHYRYLADYRLADRGLVPLDLAQIENNGYGDCKDLTMLLTSMLRGLGMDAEPAFVVRGDYAPALLIPDLGAPNHVIVRAAVDGKVWWIDATNPVLLPGYVPADLQDRWAIVAGKNGVPRQETIPLEEASIALDVSQRSRFYSDGTSEIDSSTLLSGPKLLSSMQFEHDNGKSALDRALCSDRKNCTASRLPMDQMKPPYVVKLLSLRQPAGAKQEGKYVSNFDDEFLAVDAFKNYRETGGVGDYNVGSPMIRQVSHAISGVKFTRPPKSCHVRSRWFDYDFDIRTQSKDNLYKFRVAEKVAWISHDEMMSDEFGELLDQVQRCREDLQYSYTIDPSAPDPH